jgi:hypothetical protein
MRRANLPKQDCKDATSIPRSRVGPSFDVRQRRSPGLDALLAVLQAWRQRKGQRRELTTVRGPGRRPAATLPERRDPDRPVPGDDAARPAGAAWIFF